jgi:competence ComEA-like helix-hairpin-helix protein
VEIAVALTYPHASDSARLITVFHKNIFAQDCSRQPSAKTRYSGKVLVFHPATLRSAAIFLVLLGPVQAQNPLPPGQGREVVERVCAPCHGVARIALRKLDKDGWARLVDAMVNLGAKGTDEDIKTVVQYLSATFPLPDSEKMNPDKVNVNKASSVRLTNTLKLFPEEAEAIVAYREKNGNFKEWQDLAKVPGVDPKKIENRKDHIIF